MKYPREKRGGQALVEAIVAISVLTIGFMGMFTLLAQSLGLNRVVADNYTGTYLATEGVEIVKNIIDSNRIQGRAWNAGLGDGDYEAQYNTRGLSANANRALAFDPGTELYSYDSGTPTTFKRLIRVKTISGHELQVNSITTWTSRGGSAFTANIEDHFFNWR